VQWAKPGPVSGTAAQPGRCSNPRHAETRLGTWHRDRWLVAGRDDRSPGLRSSRGWRGSAEAHRWVWAGTEARPAGRGRRLCARRPAAYPSPTVCSQPGNSSLSKHQIAFVDRRSITSWSASVLPPGPPTTERRPAPPAAEHGARGRPSRAAIRVVLVIRASEHAVAGSARLHATPGRQPAGRRSRLSRWRRRSSCVMSTSSRPIASPPFRQRRISCTIAADRTVSYASASVHRLVQAVEQRCCDLNDVRYRGRSLLSGLLELPLPRARSLVALASGS